MLLASRAASAGGVDVAPTASHAPRLWICSSAGARPAKAGHTRRAAHTGRRAEPRPGVAASSAAAPPSGGAGLLRQLRSEQQPAAERADPDQDEATVRTLAREPLPSQTPAPPGRGRTAAASLPLDAEAGAEEAATQQATRRSRRTGAMPESQREAIRQAMLNRGPISAEHRRRISRAMRDAYATNLRHRQTGKPKRCSYCGQNGHNRRSCEALVRESATAAAAAAAQELVRQEAAAPEAVAADAQVNDQRQRLQQLKEALAAVQQEAAPGALPSLASIGSSVDNVDLEGRPRPAPASAWPAAAAGRRRTLRPIVAATGASTSVMMVENGTWAFPLPARQEDCVEQTAQAVLRAYDDGIRLQAVELLLPETVGTSQEGSWPGGIRQQFRVALPLVEGLLRRLKQHSDLGGRITAEWLDDSDCVAAWRSERLAAVVFPTAEVLGDIRRMQEGLAGRGLLLVINPQWHPRGQVISDFGFGSARQRAERFIDSFEETYCLRQVRVLGDDARVLRCYPGAWQVHYATATHKSLLLAADDERPTYQRLLELLKAVPGSRASQSWFERALTNPSIYGEFSAPEGQPQQASDERTAAAATPRPRPAPALTQQLAGEPVLRDIVTGEVVRDYRLEPVRQIARWLGEDGGGSAARRSGSAPRRSSGAGPVE